jgi:hypothetical protein
MQIQKNKESTTHINHGTNSIRQFPSRGTIIKTGIMTGGAIAATVIMTYYLRKRANSKA